MALTLPLVLTLASASVMAAQAAAEGQEVPSKAPARQAQRIAPGANLDDRIKTLALALDLDAEQQSQVRRVLENQREQVSEVWKDTSVPPVYRVSATRAISDKTADQIRALLSDEQKKKFTPPRQPHDATARHSSPSAEDWMKATQSKPSAPPEHNEGTTSRIDAMNGRRVGR
jgi:hypothetical protein